MHQNVSEIDVNESQQMAQLPSADHLILSQLHVYPSWEFDILSSLQYGGKP